MWRIFQPIRQAALVLAGGLAAITSAGAGQPLLATRAAVEQWVQTRQLISRTRTDWESEKEMLRQSKALFERELAGVQDQSARVETNFAQVDRERSAAEQELKDFNDVLDHAAAVAAELEKTVKSLVPRLPETLQETLQPMLARLPADAATTKVGATERVQTVVSILNEIDKFNGAVTLGSEKRQNDRGEEVAVEMVYLGLGAAYFVNQTGDFAGTGHPGPAGWKWSVDPALATDVREIIRIYRGERTATFIPLPVTLR